MNSKDDPCWAVRGKSFEEALRDVRNGHLTDPGRSRRGKKLIPLGKSARP